MEDVMTDEIDRTCYNCDFCAEDVNGAYCRIGEYQIDGCHDVYIENPTECTCEQWKLATVIDD